MKIELTIKVDYLPSWGVYEGLRELVQNGKDAETEFQAKLEVRHRKDANILVIENEGATIPHEALLFGHTTKSQRSDMIGKFGEGLKLGVLALVRAGYPVKIRSGDEVWIPTIERSNKFNADVLVFEIMSGRTPKNRVSVEISNIKAEDWAEMKQCFLFLNPGKKDDRISTTYGTLLLNPEYKGKLFVKGILVEKDVKYDFGYDLGEGVNVDRDRRMISRWDLNWRTKAIWSESVAKRSDIFGNFFDMLEEEKADIGDLDESAARGLPSKLLDQAKERFVAKFGKDAIPVANLAESKDIEHLGKKGVVVNKTLKAVLQSIMGSTQQVQESLKKEATTRYSWSDLSKEEKANLELSVSLIDDVAGFSLNNVDVVDFRSDSIMGMYEPTGERVLIARKHLISRRVTLEILVHEVGHRAGGDGDKGHVDNMERIWSGIAEGLLNRLGDKS